MLKSEIRMQSLGSSDRIFKTCCALYILLLEADSVDVPREGSMKCDFHDDDFGHCNENDVPSAVHELYCQCVALNYVGFFLLVITIFLLMKILQHVKTLKIMISQLLKKKMT